jgi:amidase
MEMNEWHLDGSQWSRDFDVTIPCAISVAPGAKVAVDLHCCSLGAVDRTVSTQPEAFYSTLNYTPGMPVTGPIEVEGAEVGDTLAVEILEIELAEQGWTMTLQGRGILGHRLQTGESRLIPIRDGHAWFTDTVGIPLRPMIGSIGTTPPGAPVRAGMVGLHGGNMDCTLLGADSTLLLPILTPGARLALGDLHAVMGDGEVGVAGLEIAGKVHLRLHLVRGLVWPLPLVLSQDKVATLYSDVTLDAAAVGVTERMANFLCTYTHLSPSEAAMFLSLAGDLRICQVVGLLRTCRMEVSLPLLAQLGFDVDRAWRNHCV